MGSGWRVEINVAKLGVWLSGLASWIIFVFFLAVARFDLGPTWEEIFWLIWPAVAFVALVVGVSFGLAYGKLMLKLMAGKAGWGGAR